MSPERFEQFSSPSGAIEAIKAALISTRAAAE
jgi:hypothetical protein